MTVRVQTEDFDLTTEVAALRAQRIRHGELRSNRIAVGPGV